MPEGNTNVESSSQQRRLVARDGASEGSDRLDTSMSVWDVDDDRGMVSECKDFVTVALVPWRPCRSGQTGTCPIRLDAVRLL